MNIYLIGYMGSGKTTLGMRLARLLDMQFIDMDKYLEHRQQRSIPDIFREEGENAFRIIERQTLHELAARSNQVVATGGGSPCFFDNMDTMNASGTAIYIKVSAAELARRLAHSREERPLVKGKSGEELRALIVEMLNKRTPFYSKAKLTVEGDRLTAEDILAAIQHALR